MKSIANTMKIGFSGHVTLILTPDNGRGEAQVVRDFDNLILDSGLNQLCTQLGIDTPTLGSQLIYCKVGTGTTAPSSGQTALVSQVGPTQVRSLVQDYPMAGTPVYSETIYTYTFTAGSVTGDIAEVGFARASTGPLFSRALILDGGGDPLPLTVSESDVLTVVYRIRAYPPTTDWTGTVTMNGIPYDVTVRAGNAAIGSTQWQLSSLMNIGWLNNYVMTTDQALSAISTVPGSLSEFSGQKTYPTYVSGSFEQEIKVLLYPVEGNEPGGLATVVIRSSTPSGWWFQINYDPPLPKDVTKTLTLGFKMSFGRV